MSKNELTAIVKWRNKSKELSEPAGIDICKEASSQGEKNNTKVTNEDSCSSVTNYASNHHTKSTARKRYKTEIQHPT